MRRLFLAAVLSLPLVAVAASVDIPSGVYANDPGHSYVTFSYKHQGWSYPRLRAESVNGELNLDADDLSASTVAIAIAVDSIRSNIGYFDDELASAKFFNAGRYPHIAFVGESLEMQDDTRGTLRGRVSIRGIERPLALEVTINGAKPHPFTGTPVIGVSAKGSLERSDFGLDRFIPAVSDQVDLVIEMEFARGSTEASAAAAATAQALFSDD